MSTGCAGVIALPARSDQLSARATAQRTRLRRHQEHQIVLDLSQDAVESTASLLRTSDLL